MTTSSDPRVLAFMRAANDFIAATGRLAEAWEACPDGAELLGYGESGLPSFDELSALVLDMEPTWKHPHHGRDYRSSVGDTFAGQPLMAGTLMRWDPTTSEHFPV